MQVLTLNDGIAEVQVVPTLGGGLASYDLLVEDRREPLFRPCRTPATAGFLDLANFNMLPWSNRISGGGFTSDGTFYALPLNVPGMRFPIHGNGFLLPWSVTAASAKAVTLALRSEGPGPYRYDGETAYRLDGGALTMSIAMTNRASVALPYGGGFHPWLPRTPGLMLTVPMAQVVLKDAEVMPASVAPVAEHPEFDFRDGRALPHGLLDNDFLGWDGTALIDWRDRGIQLAIDATGDPRLRTIIIYSPGKAANFFCIEPVSHRSDAVNLASGPEVSGLVMLQPGERLELTVEFRPSQDGRLS